jgi:hypothetical protein
MPARKNNELYVYFWVSSSRMSVEEISKSTGLSFDESWNKGDRLVTGQKNGKPIISKQQTHKDSGGRIVVGKGEESFEVEALVKRLLKKVVPRSTRIKKLSSRCEMGINCVIYWREGGTPPLCFEADTIKRVASLGAGLDIDLYLLGGPKK